MADDAELRRELAEHHEEEKKLRDANAALMAKFEETMTSLETKLATLSTDLAAANEKIVPGSSIGGGNPEVEAKLHAEIVKLKSELEEREKTATATNNQLNDATASKSIAERKVEELRSDVEAKDVEIETLKRANARTEQLLTAERGEKKELQSEIDDMTELLEGAARAKQEADAMRVEVEKMKTAVAEAKDAKLQAETRQYDAESRLSNFDSDMKLLQMANERLENSAQTMRREINELKEEKAKKNATLEAKLHKAAEDNAELDGEQDVDKVRSIAREQVLLLKEQVAELMRDLNRARKDEEQVKEADEAKRAMREMRAEMERFKEEAGVARLEARMTKQREQLDKAKSLLNEEREMRLTAEEERKDAVHSTNVMREQKTATDVRCDELERNYKDERRKSAQQQLMLDELKTKLSATEVELQELKARVAEGKRERRLEQKCARLEQELETATEKMALERVQAEAREAKLSRELKQLKEKLGASEADRARAGDARRRVEGELAIEKSQWEQTERDVRAALRLAETEVAKYKAEAETARERALERDEATSKAERDAKGWREKYDLEVIAREQYNKTKDQNELRIKQLKEKYDAEEERIDQMDKDVRKAKRELNTANKMVASLEDDVSDEKRKRQDEVRSLKRELDRVKADLESANRRSRI